MISLVGEAHDVRGHVQPVPENDLPCQWAGRVGKPRLGDLPRAADPRIGMLGGRAIDAWP